MGKMRYFHVNKVGICFVNNTGMALSAHKVAIHSHCIIIFQIPISNAKGKRQNSSWLQLAKYKVDFVSIFHFHGI